MNELDAALEQMDADDLRRFVRTMFRDGVALTFHGRRGAFEIARKVRPRVTRLEPELHVGPDEERGRNLLIEGENLQAMVTLYKYQGQVDLILTDPPYNTGQQFRYNDRWDEDPNDPDLGMLVAKEDGSRHTKWIKAIVPRLQMMKAMLKPGGVIAVCIDDNELFHLGMVMDEIFGEENRLAIINWQKTTPKGARHAVTTTEYVLVYARDRELARTGLLPRSEKADARFQNQDHDPVSTWKQGDLTGKRSPTSHTNMLYAVQSPFTGKLLYPPENRHWAFEKAKIKGWLEEWGPKYEDRDLKDGRTKALVIKGAPVPDDPRYSADHPALVAARKKAKARLDAGAWPRLYFGKTGTAKPMYKVYASEVRAGSIPTTFWLEEESIDRLEQLGSMSWAATESGRSREGLEELDEIVGKRHGFETVKPLSLITKLIQIWCPPGGIVLDPYAGSGTVGQAVLALNAATDAGRRFILIEQGAPSAGDKYARSLTWLRLKNAVTGERPNGRKTAALGGGFEFRVLTRTIDAKTVMAMKRDELIDVVITSHWTSDRRGAPTLRRVDDDAYKHLVGLDDTGASYFVLWSQEEGVGQLDMQTYREVLAEAKSAGLSTPFNVYARYELYQSPHVRFWKIPDKILAHLGLNEEAIYHDVADAPDVEGVVAA